MLIEFLIYCEGHDKGDVAEIEKQRAEQLIEAGKAKLYTEPEPKPVKKQLK